MYIKLVKLYATLDILLNFDCQPNSDLFQPFALLNAASYDPKLTKPSFDPESHDAFTICLELRCSGSG